MPELLVKTMAEHGDLKVPLPIEVLSKDLETVARGTGNPITGEVFRTDLPVGEYIVLVTLPDGRVLRQTVRLAERQEAVLRFSAASPHEWLEWETFVGMVQPKAEERRPEMADVAWQRPRFMSAEADESAQALVRVYLQLWTKRGPDWKVQPLQPTSEMFDGRVARLTLHSEFAHPQFIRLFGPKYVPSRFMALPPADGVSVVVQPSDAANLYDGGVALRVASQNQLVEPMMRVLRDCDRKTQQALVPVAVRTAEMILMGKMERPSEALTAGYYLLRTGAYEGLHDWLRNFTNYFPDFADPPVLWGWQCLRDARFRNPNEAASYLIEAARRGIPAYTEGLQLLFEGLELMAFGEDAPQAFRGQAKLSLQHLRPFLQACRNQRLQTTFLGTSPVQPSLQPQYMDAETEIGLRKFDIKVKKTVEQLEKFQHEVHVRTHHLEHMSAVAVPRSNA